VRRVLVTLACVGLALGGTQVGHAVAYRLVERSATERADLLAGTGHTYLQYASLAIAVLFVLALLALLAEVRATAAGRAATRPRLWMFGVVAPATFVVQEHLERVIADGAIPWETALQGTFVVGLLLQVPFALAAYALARLVLGVTGALARLLRRRPQPRLRPRVSWPRVPSTRLFSSALRTGLGARGPPLLPV
jgi:hypothetical protein